MNEENQIGNDYSILTVIILLVYVLSTFITSYIVTIPIHIGNFSLVLNWKMIDLITPGAGLLAGIGVFGLVDERSSKSKAEKMLHSVIPFATTVSLGIILRNVAMSAGWVMILILGGVLLYLVFMSECIICNPADPRISVVSILLTGLAYATFVITAIGVRSNISRLVLEFPLILLSSFILAMRILSLYESVKDIEIKAAIISLITAEAAAAFHYWPIQPLSYSLFLFLGFYILTNIVIILPQKGSLRNAFKSQLWILVISVILMVFIEIQK